MSIFPFIDASGVTDTKKVTDLPLLKEYAYDYAKNELLLDENGWHLSGGRKCCTPDLDI